jgi:hypothetical protein
MTTSLGELTKAELLVAQKLIEIRDARIDFATNHHRNTRGEQMDFSGFPHIRQLYNSLAKDIVLQGSVQCFKSEWAVIDHFACAYVGLSVFFVVPKYEARTTYVQNRVNRCVENVPEYKKIVGNGFFDSVALKSFGKGVVKYVGSNVLADFKEFPGDVLVVEEVDECHQENLDYALDRLRASRYQFRRYLGNPKYRGRGINAYFQNSDQREWEVPCLKCGEFSELDWFETVVEPILGKDGNVLSYKLRDEEWHEGIRRDIKIICPNCKDGALERASQRGVWVPRNAGHKVEGYHISMLCNPINTIAGMWERFQRALDDPAKLQQFYNSDLGLPYVSIGNKVTETMLDGCIDEDYAFDIAGSVGHVKDDGHIGPCSMGVDVGGNLDVRISSLEDGGVRRAVFIGKIKTTEELHELVDRYNVEKCVIDSMPEITLVQDFQDTAQCDVWLCRYRGEGSDRRKTYDTMGRVINADRTECLDRAFASIRSSKNVLPVNYTSVLMGEYAKEMCNPIRQIIEDAKGNARYEWTKCVDHQRHADSYDLLASQLLREAVLDYVEIG